MRPPTLHPNLCRDVAVVAHKTVIPTKLKTHSNGILADLYQTGD